MQGKLTARLQCSKRHALPFGVWPIALLAAAVSAKAGPLQIQTVDYQFSTYTYSRLTDLAYNPDNPDPAHITIVSNQTSSTVPVGDSITSPTWNWSQNSYTGPSQLESVATAGVYRVEAFAESAGLDSQFGRSISAAMTRITFVPQATGLGTFNFDLLGKRQYYGAQLLRLTDLTLGQEVWSYGDAGMGGGTERFERLLSANTTYQDTIPWAYTGMANEYAAYLEFDTFLSAGSTYELTLFATVESQAPETEHVVLEWVAALEVPEPSTLAIVGSGALLLALRRRKMTHR